VPKHAFLAGNFCPQVKVWHENKAIICSEKLINRLQTDQIAAFVEFSNKFWQIFIKNILCCTYLKINQAAVY
jgi:hypothetical protein